MKIEIVTDGLPAEAMDVRKDVFEQEQGFTDEFDQTDREAVHFVLYLSDVQAVGTCRVFRKEGNGLFFLGRLAVRKSYRGRRLGTALMQTAEDYVRSVGGKGIRLHAQYTAAGFYRTLGYTEDGFPDEEQGCPHVWMKKEW